MRAQEKAEQEYDQGLTQQAEDVGKKLSQQHRSRSHGTEQHPKEEAGLQIPDPADSGLGRPKQDSHYADTWNQKIQIGKRLFSYSARLHDLIQLIKAVAMKEKTEKEHPHQRLKKG
jgi:hypothetical protein